MKKNVFIILLISLFVVSCGSSNNIFSSTHVAETVEAITKATEIIEQEVNDRLTEIASEITDTPTFVPATSTSAATFTPTITATIPNTSTPLPTDTATVAAPQYASGACNLVVDNWCLSHEGCATIDIKNDPQLPYSVHIVNQGFNVDYYFSHMGPLCTITARPGKYVIRHRTCNFANTGEGEFLIDFSHYLIINCD